MMACLKLNEMMKIGHKQSLKIASFIFLLVKLLKKYPNAAHESYLNQYRVEWTQDIAQFMEKAR
jgi:hypothetical protein